MRTDHFFRAFLMPGNDCKSKVNEEHMTGLYATRQFEVPEPIAVYLGEDIGAYDGDGMVECAWC